MSITAMWAWDNPVPASQDARGRGYAPAAPDELVAFTRAHDLTRVMLSAPWAADEGPVGQWFTAALRALDGAGVSAAALGGDPGWLTAPRLAVQWSRAARAAGATQIQLDVEPWALPAWQSDRDGAIRRWLAVLDAVRADAPECPVGIDCPWWLASEPWGHGTVLDAALERADRIVVVAFSDHAAGPDGIVALATPAARRSTVPFTIGVETDTPEVAGGARFTFYDEGPVVLEREAALVDAAFADTAGYEGVAVEHHRAWRALLEP
ncbi:hypothetical protein [Cellulomonas edaphi]|uniref:Sugar phosphate isomerase/epimerase n=1 Tax=Cellulomonas edaphi TaxID=3053468 RepID=A0ABT7S2J1_9CELL|nr:hypothetical protein [Cellulomons edaphi]MDM7829826.1 hypothetical protein [Cellulomons edaphi]